jgi:hypothetical protein
MRGVVFVQIACILQVGAALQGPLRRLAPTVSVTDKPLPVDTPRGDIVRAAEPAVAVEEPAVAVEAAPIFYATYDLRLFEHGSRVAPLTLITTKITAQAGLSVAAAAVAWSSVGPQLEAFDGDLWPVAAAAIWSGVFVNAFASVLQVSGQQAVGPARAQVVYASQPLWAAILSLIFLGETVGVEGCVGGALFIAACFLAATAPEPDPNCGVDVCEV